MKNALTGLLLIVAPLVGSEEEFRTFKSADGREISASILGCDANARKVMLKIKGGQRRWISFSALSQEDTRPSSLWPKGA